MANENTRLRILETSLGLFSEKGYDSVGVQEIADACFVTKPALYYYFSSKLGILESIMEEYIEPFIALLEESAFYNGNVNNTISSFAYCFIENSCKNMPTFMMLMSMQYAPQKSEFHQAFLGHCSKIIDITVSIFDNAGAELGNMNGRQRQFAMTLLGMLSFYIYEHKKDEHPALNKREVDLLIHQFLHGIYS